MGHSYSSLGQGQLLHVYYTSAIESCRVGQQNTISHAYVAMTHVTDPVNITTG